MRNKNIGHGHVYERPDGVRARCGGPGICSDCSKDAAMKLGETTVQKIEWDAEAYALVASTGLVDPVKYYAYVEGATKQAQAFDKDFFLEVIREWKEFWMNQTQNSKQDYDNYFRRAIAVDANMSHHLATLLAESLKVRKKKP